MDGLDRRILQQQRIKTKDHEFAVLEMPTRVFVDVRITFMTTGSFSTLQANVEDLAAMIRMLEVAKERLEVLGHMDGLEKIVP